MTTRGDYEGLLSTYEWVLVGWLAFILLAIAFAVVRYRRRPPDAVSRRSEATVVEILYALVIGGFVGFLVYHTFSTEHRVDTIPARASATIHVTAFQWGWRFDYPGGATVVGDQNHPPTAAVPARVAIRFTGESRDVNHAFYVPGLKFKRDVNPRTANVWGMVFPRGSYRGECAEFCGFNHTGMSFRIVALPQADYQSWLSDHGGSG